MSAFKDKAAVSAKVIHLLPSQICKPGDGVSVTYIIKPFSFDPKLIAVCCAVVIRGGKNPLVVLSSSKTAFGLIVKELDPIFCTTCAETSENENTNSIDTIAILKVIL